MASSKKILLSVVTLGLGASLALSGCAGGTPQASKQPGEKTVIRFA